jgi:hypothetical protein
MVLEKRGEEKKTSGIWCVGVVAVVLLIVMYLWM